MQDGLPTAIEASAIALPPGQDNPGKAVWREPPALPPGLPVRGVQILILTRELSPAGTDNADSSSTSSGEWYENIQGKEHEGAQIGHAPSFPGKESAAAVGLRRDVRAEGGQGQSPSVGVGGRTPNAQLPDIWGIHSQGLAWFRLGLVLKAREWGREQRHN